MIGVGYQNDYVTFQILSLDVLNLLKIGLMDQTTLMDLNLKVASLNVIQNHEN